MEAKYYDQREDVYAASKQRLPVNRSRIASRVRGREAVAELLSLLDAEIRDDPNAMEAIVETLECFTNRNKPVAPVAVEPIARLGAMLVPFGQHVGKRFDDVPLDYLDWLCREQESFYKTLRAYLKHPELESRRRE